MNLTILTQYYPPEIGAPQARLSYLARRFVENSHSVTVLTGMPNYPGGSIYPQYGGMFKAEEKDNVKVLRTWLYPTNKTDFLRRLTNYFSFVLSSSLIGSILLRKSDFLMVESPPLFLGIAGLWLSRLKRARMILNVSDLWPESAVRLGVVKPSSIPYKVSAALELFLYRHAWLVSGQSKGIVSGVENRCRGVKTYLVSNGVDLGLFHPAQSREDIQAGLRNGANCSLLYAGLHGLAQGLEQILEAAFVLRDGVPYSFILLGEGPEKAKLKEIAKKRELTNVRFMDPVPFSSVPGYLASCDIALITLKGDIPGAVPSKLYEAMASGRPVLLMAEGEAAQIVRQHNAGVVVRPGDISTLVHELKSLGENESLRRELGANGRRCAESYFDRSKIADAFTCFLEEQLAQER